MNKNAASETMRERRRCREKYSNHCLIRAGGVDLYRVGGYWFEMSAHRGICDPGHGRVTFWVTSTSIGNGWVSAC